MSEEEFEAALGGPLVGVRGLSVCGMKVLLKKTVWGGIFRVFFWDHEGFYLEKDIWGEIF